MDTLLDLYVAYNGNPAAIDAMGDPNSDSYDPASYGNLMPMLSSLFSATSEAFNATWPPLLAPAVACVYRLVCLCDAQHTDPMEMFSTDDEAGLVCQLGDELPGPEAGLTLADGAELPAAQTVRDALVFLLDVGLLAYEQGRLAAVRPVPDPAERLTLDAQQADLLHGYHCYARLMQQLSQAYETGDLITLGGVAARLGRDSADIKTQLLELAADSDERDRIGIWDADTQFDVGDLRLLSGPLD